MPRDCPNEGKVSLVKDSAELLMLERLRVSLSSQRSFTAVFTAAVLVFILFLGTVTYCRTSYCLCSFAFQCLGLLL